MTLIPTTASAFDKLRGKFSAWLVANGSELYAPTNSWEMLRFLAVDNTGIIYRNQAGRLRFVNGADEAVAAFVNKRPWRAVPKAELTREERSRRNLIASLIERDGCTCVYCGKAMPGDDITIEHFVARTSGGPDHLANTMLAHGDCNKAAGHLSAREKIEMIVRMRTSSC